MKIWKLTMASLLVAGTAAAQQPGDPVPPPPPPPTPVPAPEPEPEPEPTPPPAPTPAPSGFVETAPPPMTEPHVDNRPGGFSVGIGFGYDLPNSLETPNTTSARFRLPSGLTFEPVVRLQQQSREIDVGASTEDKITTVEAGALARFPFRSRGRVDLVLLGGAFVTNVTESPDIDDMDRTTTTFEARYGLAVEFWISSHWQISMNALNTVFSTQKVAEEMGAGTETVTTTTLFGAIYDPVVSAMIHLYY